MTTLQLNIPDEIAGLMNSISEPREKFVLDAIQEKLARDGENDFNELLSEGYRATFAEDAALAREFEAADFERK